MNCASNADLTVGNPSAGTSAVASAPDTLALEQRGAKYSPAEFRNRSDGEPRYRVQCVPVGVRSLILTAPLQMVGSAKMNLAQLASPMPTAVS